MEIRQLKYFVAIAESHSFSSASRKVFLSQSALSQQIRLLEEEFGVPLFVRTSHRVDLTEGGAMLLPLARRVLAGVEECRQRMSEVDRMLCGELHIGMTHSMDPYVRTAMAEFMRLHPHVMLYAYYQTIPELMGMLHERKLDLAFCIHVEGEDAYSERIPIVKSRHCAVMRATHPLAGRETLSLGDLQHQRLVLPEKGFRTSSAVEHYLVPEGGGTLPSPSDEHSALRVCAVVNDPGALFQLLRLTNFISILPEHIVQDVPDLRAVRVKELSHPTDNYAYFLRGVYRKRSSVAFLDLLQQQVRQRGELL